MQPRGFWDTLGDWLLPDEDRGTYAEGLSRGGYLLSVEATDAQYERVLDILDDEGTIDIDERAQSWRSEGWTGASGSPTSDVLSGSTANLTTGEAGTTSGMAAGATRFSDEMAFTGAGSATSVPPVSGSARGVDLDTDTSTRLDRDVGVASTREVGLTGTDARLTDRGEEVIPVAEERLRVGKRDVSHGRVRIRSYVVETPVEEQVTLREERVAVERRRLTVPWAVPNRRSKSGPSRRRNGARR
jgi:hypothetical protein